MQSNDLHFHFKVFLASFFKCKAIVEYINKNQQESGH